MGERVTLSFLTGTRSNLENTVSPPRFFDPPASLLSLSSLSFVPLSDGTCRAAHFSSNKADLITPLTLRTRRDGQSAGQIGQSTIMSPSRSSHPDAPSLMKMSAPTTGKLSGLGWS